MSQPPAPGVKAVRSRQAGHRAGPLAAKIEVAAGKVADLDRRLGQIDSAIEEAAKRGKTNTALSASHPQQIPEEGGFEVFWVDGRGAQAQGWYWQIFGQYGLRQAWMQGPFATAKRAYNSARGL